MKAHFLCGSAVFAMVMVMLGSSAQGQILPAFASTNAGPPGVSRSAAAWGDYDNDGRLDLLLAGLDVDGNALSQIWRNLGDGTFTNLNAGLPGVFEGSVAWGDYDNDGKLDILLTGNNGFPDFIGIAQVWRNLGDGTFTNINAGLTGVQYSSAVWGDYDNDGKLEILLSGYDGTDGICQVWRNLGNGIFTNINAGLPGVYHSSVAWGDYDNDGYLDILLTGSSSTGLISQVWRNLGNGTFTNTDAGLPGVVAGSVAWGDYDNDGKLDILLTGMLSDGVTPISQVLRNLGNGSFGNIDAPLPAVRYSSVAWGDYDNDGKLDILITGLLTDGATTISQVWRNLGDGMFTNIDAGLPGVYHCSVAWGDYDNDGNLDIFLTGKTSSVPNPPLWRNNTSLTNNLPSTPASLTALVTPSGVSLSWAQASDEQTPAGGLSYNLRVGANAGGFDVISPQADVNDGFRRLPQMGNVQARTSATLTNLMPGTTYYWSVQAIDTAFAGSSFASEQTFFVPAAPRVQTLSATNITMNGARLGAMVNPSGAATSVYFQYGLDTNHANATMLADAGGGTNDAPVSVDISALQAGAVYYVQAVASNSLGVVQGSCLQFSTLVPPPFLRFIAPANGQAFQLNFEGISNRTYNVWISGDLTNWTALGPASQLEPGIFSYTDPESTNAPMAFYQVRSP